MTKVQHILLIEDNRADQETIRIMLASAKHKYKLFFASSLAEGQQLLAEGSIDLVLLDLGLPDSVGFQTLLRYLEFASSVPVVVMTGMNKQQIGTKAVRAGAQDFLVKEDFDATQLLKSIRYALERFRHQAAAEQLANTYSTEGERLRELYRLASLGNWEMDVVSNEMTWSDELFHILEEAPHSFSPTFSDYLKYVHTEDRQKVEAFIAAAMEKEQSGPIEHRILIDNRKVKVLSVRTKISFDDKSNRVLLIGSVQNVTPREPETSASSENGSRAQPHPQQEEQDTEMPDSRAIINQISFNIRTPLSTIINIMYLLEQTPLSTRQKALFSDLRTAFDDLTFTLSNLVNLSILSNDDLPLAKEYYRPLDLLESIQRVMTFKASQNNRELDMYIDSRLAFMVQGDSNIVGQLFFCLMELAFSHSLEEAFLKLRCTLEQSESGEQLMVQLEYSGVIPDWPSNMDQATVLSPLQKLKPQFFNEQRDQLLALVFVRLCRQLNVDYQLNATKGGVYLDMQIPLQRKESTDAIPAQPTRPLKILLVEDHPMHQIATKQILSNWSDMVSVELASNGKIALEKIQQDDFDIVLMDLQMPVMDGMKATAQIRATNPVPIIALTATTSKQEEERCYDVGMNDYLAKPFQAEDLQRRIMRLTHKELVGE